MEISQLEQMIRWLDAERKRDKAAVLSLEERFEQQQQTIEAQAREIDVLHQEISSLQADLRRTDDYPPMIEKTNRDLTAALEEVKNQARTDKLEAERARLSEIDMLTEQIGDLDKKIRPFFHYAEELKARASGEQRLQAKVQQVANDIDDLGKRLEDRLQSIIYLEEQRRADARRITTLEGDILPVRKSTEDLAIKLVRLEDSIRKIPGRVEEAVQIAKSYDPRIEALRVADFQREQRMKQYADQANKVNLEVVRLVEQTQKYALLYNQNRQALEALEAFQVRMEKRQNEIAEMQRVAEERLKRQWEEWQSSFARDWQKRQVSEEDRWRRQDLSNQKVLDRFTGIEEQTELYYREIVSLWDELRTITDRYAKSVQEVLVANREMPDSHMKELRKFAEEKHKELL